MSAGVRVVEVDRSDRQDRYRSGKSDPLDAESAAWAALSGKAKGAPRGRDGTVRAIRALMVAKRSARGERTQSINQARALVVTGPDDLRTRGETPRSRVVGVRAPREMWPAIGSGQVARAASPRRSHCSPTTPLTSRDHQSRLISGCSRQELLRRRSNRLRQLLLTRPRLEAGDLLAQPAPDGCRAGVRPEPSSAASF
jgi:hypothetical protein